MNSVLSLTFSYQKHKNEGFFLQTIIICKYKCSNYFSSLKIRKF